MPKKIGGATREDLVNAPLPQQTKTYTVISHSYAINTILQALEDNGFTVEEEDYRCNDGGKVAHGSFVVNYQADPELSMVYSFSNSYDKTLRFKSAVGAKVILNDSYMLCDMDHWIRKHTGTADNETEKLIVEHITNAKSYFAQLVKDKEAMKGINITLTEFGSIIGELFLRKILTIDQVSTIGKEHDNPSYQYPTGKLNLWTVYNHVINALKQTHPSKWMQNQISVHLYFTSRYNLETFDELEEQTEDQDKIVIEGEAVTPIPGILEQVPEAIILPGFEPPVNQEMPKEQLEPMQEYQNPNQITIDQIIEAETPVAEERVSEELPEKTAGQDEPVEEVIPEDSTPAADYVPATNPNEMYLAANDFPGVEVGELFEFESSFVEVIRTETVEGIEYLVCIPASLDETESSTVDLGEKPVEEEKFSEELPETDEPEEPAPWEKDELAVLPSPEASQEVTAPVPEPVVEPVETVMVGGMEPMPEEEDPQVIKVIAKELNEIYGYSPKFTYKKTDQQYNITLESGEILSLPITYIDGLL